MINQISMYQLEEDEVSNIHVKIHDNESEEFIRKLPNPLAWDISNSGMVTKMTKLYICFLDLEVFIESMQYSYNHLHKIHWETQKNEIQQIKDVQR